MFFPIGAGIGTSISKSDSSLLESNIICQDRKHNNKIGARLKHFYLNKETIIVQLTGNAQFNIPLLIAENGVSQMIKGAIQGIADTFEVK